MRHYEVVVMIHPDRSDQAKSMIERYMTQLKESGGQVHRFEDWGRRQLAYPINKLLKAHYILVNIECGQEALDELTTAFRYNDAVLRNMVLQSDKAITEESPILKAGSNDRDGRRDGRRDGGRDNRRDNRRDTRRDSDDRAPAAKEDAPATEAATTDEGADSQE